MDRSKKLARQIERHLGQAEAEREIAALAAAAEKSAALTVSPGIQTVLKNFSAFLDVIDASYAKYEENIAVAERNLNISSRELVEADNAVNTMVNSLGQGFLLFNRDGICAPVYSQACQTLLETTPAGKHIADVLRLNGEDKTMLATLIRAAFAQSHAMTFDEIMRWAPKTYRHSGGRHIRIDYKCVPDARDKFNEIVMIATDISDQVKAKNLAEEHQAMFLSIERVLHDRRAFGAMIRQLYDLTALPDSALREPMNRRAVHTLKSSAGVFKLYGLVKILHELESAIKASATNIDESRAQLAKELRAVDEQFSALLGVDVITLETVKNPDQSALRDFANFLGAHGHAELRQEFLRRVCAESLIDNLRGYDLVLDDLAVNFGKKVKPIEFTGRDILLVPDHYASVLSSLTHIFRNMIMHGIEAPLERIKRGKEEAGCITIDLALKNDAEGKPMLHLTLGDDGQGINPIRLRAKLMAEDLESGWEKRSDAEVLDQIFTMDFSTSIEITPSAGRGLGMNTVRFEVEKVGGTITVESKPGQGAEFHIAMPLILDF